MGDGSRGGVLSALQSWRAQRRQSDETHWTTAQEVPPYVSSVAVLRSGLKMQRRVGAVVFLGLIGLVGYQQWHIAGLMHKVRTKEFLVVPGAADFLPVRANMVPDASIIAFARYFTDRMISVSDRTLNTRYSELRQYMTPALEVELEEQLRSKMTLLKDVRGAEIWASSAKPVIRRETRSDGLTYFVARIAGQVDRYALQRPLGMTREVATVTFRMRSSLSADDPWIFEVTSFERRTVAQQDEWDRARARTVNAAAKTAAEGAN